LGGAVELRFSRDCVDSARLTRLGSIRLRSPQEFHSSSAARLPSHIRRSHEWSCQCHALRALNGCSVARRGVDQALGITPNAVTYNALLAVANKAKLWEMALEVFSDMSQRRLPMTVETFNPLIGALAHSYQPRLAMDAFENMQRLGIAPDMGIFSTVLEMCLLNHEWGEARKFLNIMAQHDCFKERVKDDSDAYAMFGVSQYNRVRTPQLAPASHQNYAGARRASCVTGVSDKGGGHASFESRDQGVAGSWAPFALLHSCGIYSCPS
jgi:pentatricopeptide repeat protein